MIALKNSIPSLFMTLSKILNSQLISAPKNQLFHALSVYSPPNSTIEYQLHLIKYLHTLTLSPSHIIIVGDFNAPEINWSSLTGGTTFSKALHDLIFDSNLPQLIHSPTLIKGIILDLVLTNSEEIIITSPLFMKHDRQLLQTTIYYHLQ